MERRLAVLAVCVLLGAALSVGVAWACAAWSAPGPTGLWMPGVEPGRAKAFAAAAGAALAAPGAVRTPETITSGFGVQWTALAARTGNPWPTAAPAQFVHVLAGWPAPALEGGLDVPAQPLVPRVTVAGNLVTPLFPQGAPPPVAPTRAVSVIVVEGRTGPVPGAAPGKPAERLLPWSPVWRGVVIDVLFYGALMVLLVPGPMIAWRWTRALRGRCMACGYPRGTSAVCTECGRPVPASRGLALLREAFWASATPARRRAVKWTVLALLALVPGAIVNVAVAWGCATASGVKPSQSPIVRAEPEPAWWRRHAPPGAAEAAPQTASSARLGPGKSWTSMWGPPGTYVVRIRAGWPMPSMERDWWESEFDAWADPWASGMFLGGPRSYTLRRAALPAPRLLSGAVDPLVPMRPVFPGFLVDTLLYALPFLGILWGAAALRAWRRRCYDRARPLEEKPCDG